jgi:hypothetical protein
MFPESTEVGGRGKKRSNLEQFPMIPKGRLSEARTILRHAPDFAEQVEKGKRSPCFNAVSQYLAELRKLEEAGSDH